MIGFTALAQGLLTGRYLDGIPEGSRATQGKSFDPDWLSTTRCSAGCSGLNEVAAAARPDAGRSSRSPGRCATSG